MKLILRMELVALAMGSTVLIARPVDAQLSEAQIAARLDSSSACPTVTEGFELRSLSSSINTTPIFVRSSDPPVGMVVGVNSIGRTLVLAQTAFFQFLSMTSGNARYASNHIVQILVDDSLQIRPDVRYGDRILGSGTHLETINATVPLGEFHKIASAKQVRLSLANDVYPLKVGQLLALRAIGAALNESVSNRILPTGCIGQNPSDLQQRSATNGAHRLQGDTGSIRVRTAVTRAGKTYFEYQVEKPARIAPGSPGPAYPSALRAANINGSVTAQFVVLENGAADMDTFKVINSTDDAFSAAVQDVVPRMRFIPAEISGKPVKQLVQLPFGFRTQK